MQIESMIHDGFRKCCEIMHLSSRVEIGATSTIFREERIFQLQRALVKLRHKIDENILATVKTFSHR